jgi:hypothetical protein
MRFPTLSLTQTEFMATLEFEKHFIREKLYIALHT